VTYHCGVHIGKHYRPPAITCDGCGAKYEVKMPPPSWFLDGKPPKGWRNLRMADGSKRWDLCTQCWRDGSPRETDPVRLSTGRVVRIPR
jgi:hypothetical protein